MIPGDARHVHQRAVFLPDRPPEHFALIQEIIEYLRLFLIIFLHGEVKSDGAWYHGSNMLFTELRTGSTITQWILPDNHDDHPRRPNVLLHTAINHTIFRKFVKEAKEAGFENLKGHRSVGGMRASIYNAMPMDRSRMLVYVILNVKSFINYIQISFFFSVMADYAIVVIGQGSRLM